MKTYKAIKPKHLSENDEAIDLVNIKDENDVIMAAPDNFKIGEILTEDQIEVKECNYVDEQGTGTALFAFKKLNKHLIGDVKEFECGYTGSESNSSIYIAIVLFLILMLGICAKGFSSDTIKKPNVIVAIDGNFKEIPKEVLTTKIYTSIDGNKFVVFKSSTNKYFIKKISPKTNKEYRYYLVY